MTAQKDITIESLTENNDIQIGYLDNDIVIVDSIEKYVQISSAHIAMNAITICTQGKIQARINGQELELSKNQIAIIPPNMTATDIMISPDFNLKAIFLTNNVLQSFLREKISVWNDMMYIHRQYTYKIEENAMLLRNHCYDIISLAFSQEIEGPYRKEIIQSLIRAVILIICGALKQKMELDYKTVDRKMADNHFLRFLNLLNASPVRHRTVASYANELCISPKHLSAICKKNSGKTANEWVTEKILEEIRFYLKQTDLSIKQICDQLNFPNPSFFGKFVKAHLGMTPGEFRDS